MSTYELVRKTKIDGDFEGFDDEVLFKFVDGMYWIQDQCMYLLPICKSLTNKWTVLSADRWKKQKLFPSDK